MKMMILRVLLHLSPLWPLLSGKPLRAMIPVLFILLCYIKVFKLRQQLQEAIARGDAQEEDSIRNALHRWLSLTFLKAS